MKIRGKPEPMRLPTVSAAAKALVATPPAAADEFGPEPPPPPPPLAGTHLASLAGVGLTEYQPSRDAEVEARAIVTLLTHRADIRKKLQTQHVELVVIPTGKKMTELPEFASLRGKKTSDGRIAIGVPEENLTQLPTDAYPGNYSVGIHELAHVIQDDALTVAERVKIQDAFEARTAAGGPWTEAYGSSNVREYFAQGTNAYFGRNQGVGHSGAAWLSKNDPALYAVMLKAYGPV